MKKLIVALMAVLFLGSTTGLVMAQDASATPAAKTMKSHKGGKKHHKSGKKSKKSADTTAASSAPSTTK